MKTILVPVDLSVGSGRVAGAALKLARCAGARVIILHVGEPPPVHLHGVGFATAQIRGMLAALQRRAQKQLEHFGRRYARWGCPVITEYIGGARVPTILARAKTWRADCVVLGSQGHGAAYDLFVGSTAQGVLQHSRCPVLVIPVRPKARSVTGRSRRRGAP